MSTGVLQYPFDNVELVNSLGVATKNLEPGQVGKPKLRVVGDAAASGTNDCMAEKPYPIPGIGARCVSCAECSSITVCSINVPS